MGVLQSLPRRHRTSRKTYITISDLDLPVNPFQTPVKIIDLTKSERQKPNWIDVLPGKC